MGVATVGMAGNSAVGGLGGNSGGSTIWGGGLQPKNHSSHHEYKSTKQFELKES